LIAGITLLGLDTSSNKRKFEFSQQAVTRRLLSAFDTVIVPTSKVYRQLRDLDCPRPLVIIANPTLPLSVPCSSTADIRGDLKLPKRAQIILSVGRLTQEKNPDLLLRAFMLLKRSRPHAELVLVGPSRGHRHLKRLARTLGIADSVHMPGLVGRDLLGGYYRLADVFVLSSLSETQSLAAQEAEAFGIPVIMVDDSLESTFRHSRRIVTSPYPHQLARSIDDCLGNGGLHDGYPEAEDFCPAITAQSAKLHEIYSFLIQAAPGVSLNPETC
jgi:glycosyltransferase involved in cell wall biosynthesis